MDPSNKFAHYNLGLHRPERRVTTPRPRATTGSRSRWTPNYAPALYNLAILRDKAGATDEAIDLYTPGDQGRPEVRVGVPEPGSAAARARATRPRPQAALDTAVQLDPELASRIPADAKPSGS